MDYLYRAYTLTLCQSQEVLFGNSARGRQCTWGVQRWRIRVGRDAEAVQFIPEFESQMACANTLLWLHELRDVADG